MSVRPAMHTRDASGRQVSLLNDEPSRQAPLFRQPSYASYNEVPDMRRGNSYVSTSSSPRTPDLLRADSYDSQISNGPQSPLTPSSLNEFGGQVSYTSAYPDPTQFDQRGPIYGQFTEKRVNSLPMVRPAYERPNSFDAESYNSQSSDRSGSGKRYPCRFKDSHGCEKTFTTSGHASRHSKIHTAEKAVHCSFPGCTKKFTRADNMKQHLETHYKERSRSNTSASKSSTSAKLTMPAGVKKTSSSGRISRPASRTSQRPSISAYESYQYSSPNPSNYSPLASPTSPHDTLDMAHFQRALPSHSGVTASLHTRTTSDSYRLDALAAICTSSS